MIKKINLYLFFLCFLWFGIGCQPAANPLVKFRNIDNQIGILGPIFLELNASIQADQLIKSLKIIPEVDLNYKISNNLLEIQPKTFFDADREYQLSLKMNESVVKDLEAENDIIWKFKTRPACLNYIASTIQSPEIWRFCLDDRVKTQLSHTNGRVRGFDPSLDGNWIVYSTWNEKGGTDIWLMDRDGKKQKRLYSCEIDVCTETKFIFGNAKIAFVRINKNAKNENNPYEIFIFDISSSNASKIFIMERIQPTFLESSGDHEYFSFFEVNSDSIWVLDSKLQIIMKIPSAEGLGGSWNRKEGNFTYSTLVHWGGIPYGEINQWNPGTGSIQSHFGGKEELNEYFFPQWRPQGDWLAAGYRPIEGSASKQIVIFSKEGEQQINVTQEQSYSNSSFSWSFDGELIAYQRLQLGLSNASPEIGLWRMKDQSHFILEKNASTPKWIP